MQYNCHVAEITASLTWKSLEIFFRIVFRQFSPLFMRCFTAFDHALQLKNQTSPRYFIAIPSYIIVGLQDQTG